MKDFLKSAEEQLKFNKDKSSVLAELGDHVETKIEFFESIGYGNEASADKANEAMGDGEVIGQRLNQIHNRKRKTAKYLIFASVIVNIALHAAILLADKSDYSIPFAAALIILLCDLALTYTAMKFKSVWLSAALMIFSCAAVWLSLPYLAYPLCNLVITHSGSDPSIIYSLSKVLISVCLCAFIFLPNAFNIYHCRQMKQMKNTKKQNRIAAALRNTCLIAWVLVFALSFPYYTMNNNLCQEQARIRDELMDFAFETANEFGYDETEKLIKYLQDCKYSFEHVVENEYTEFDDVITHDTYIYRNGNWTVEFEFNYDPETAWSYCVNVFCNYDIFNVSQRYLFTSEEQGKKLSDTITEPKKQPPVDSYLYSSDFPHNPPLHSSMLPDSEPIQLPQEYIDELFVIYPHTAVGMTAQEIKDVMNGVSLLGISIGKYKNHTAYGYDYQQIDTLNNLFIYGYDYFCDNNGLCTEYNLTYDYFTI